MGLYNFSDQIVFKILRDIEHGYLEITKYNGELLKFGNPIGFPNFNNSPLYFVISKYPCSISLKILKTI